MRRTNALVFKKPPQVIPCDRKRDNMAAIPPSGLGVGVGVVHRHAAAFGQRTLARRHAALPRTQRVLIGRGRQKRRHYL